MDKDDKGSSYERENLLKDLIEKIINTYFKSPSSVNEFLCEVPYIEKEENKIVNVSCRIIGTGVIIQSKNPENLNLKGKVENIRTSNVWVKFKPPKDNHIYEYSHELEYINEYSRIHLPVRIVEIVVH